MTTQIDVKTSDMFRYLLITLTVVAGVYLMYQASSALSMLLVAGFIALAVNNPVSRLAGRLPFGGRKLAALLIFTLIGLIVSGIVALIIPLIITQGSELARQLPGYMQDLETMDNFFGQWLRQLDLIAVLQQFFEGLAAGLATSFNLLFDVIEILAANVIILMFTVVLAFLISVEAPHWQDRAASLIPRRVKPRTVSIMSKMYRAVTGFVNGQLIITSIASLSTLVLLTILGVPAPVSLAAVIWVTGLVPLVGNTAGALIVIAVALPQSLPVAIFLAVYYVIYQQIENNVLEPIIQSRTVAMTPLFVLTSAVIGAFAAGFIGALLAIPTGACLKILIDEYLSDDSSMAEA